MLAELLFLGMCDASGAVELSDRLFAVANDEDNVLRVYDAETGGAPIASYDVSPSLHLPIKAKKKKKKLKFPETDLESATRIGDTALWLTSHGRAKSEKKSAARFRFFATTATRGEALVEVIGEPYEHLLDDLIAAPSLAGLHLDEARELPAKKGGLNIEGMTASPEGGVWIGLRAPLAAGGRAILIPIANPLEVARGAHPKIGAPVFLALGGGGVRALSFWRDRYWILAGAADQPTQLYAWKPGGAPILSEETRALSGLNPEAFFSPDGRAELLVLSDDGEREFDGKACKKLKDASKKSFRGRWITPR